MLPRDLQDLVYQSFDIKELVQAFLESDSTQPNRKLWNQILADQFPQIYAELMTSDDPASVVDSWFRLTNKTLPFNTIVPEDDLADLFDTLIVLGWVDLNIFEQLLTYNFRLPSSNYGVMVLLKIHDVDAYMFGHHFGDLMERQLYDAVMFMLDRLGEEATQIKSAYEIFSELVVVIEASTNWAIRSGSSTSLETVVFRLVDLYKDEHPLDLIIENDEERSVFDYMMVRKPVLAEALIEQLPHNPIDYTYKRPDGTTYLLLASQLRYVYLYDEILKQAPDLEFITDTQGRLPIRPQPQNIRGTRRRRPASSMSESD